MGRAWPLVPLAVGRTGAPGRPWGPLAWPGLPLPGRRQGADPQCRRWEPWPWLGWGLGLSWVWGGAWVWDRAWLITEGGQGVAGGWRRLSRLGTRSQ